MAFRLFALANAVAAQDTWCPTLGDFDVAWGGVQGEGNGWRVNGEGGVHGRTSWNLLGGYIEFDMDACGGQTGVNNNFYTVSPEGGMSSGYCDIQSNDSPICMELDIIENNGNQNGATTWHVWGNKDGGCDQNGCDGKYWLNPCKFHMRTDFHEDGDLTAYRNDQVISVSGGPSSSEKNQIKQNMERLGAALISTQWSGWVPDAPGLTSNQTVKAGLYGASFAVTNVVVHAPRGIKFGPSPPTCSSPSPTPTPSPTPSGQCETFVGKNNDGTNLKSTADITSSAAGCCSKCSQTAGCVGYTWVHASGECWMKSAVDSPRDDQCGGCVTSGTYTAPTPVPTPTPTPAPTPTPTPTPTPSPTPSGQCETFVGKNNDGTNLKSTADITSSATGCCSKCSQTAGCVGYTWVHANGECWMKSAVDSPRDDQCGGCVTSGTYTPAPTPTPAPMPTPSPSPTPPGMCTISVGQNNNGVNLELTARWTSSTDACCVACSDTAGCKGFTRMNSNQCWLKSELGSLTPDANATSGFLVEAEATALNSGFFSV